MWTKTLTIASLSEYFPQIGLQYFSLFGNFYGFTQVGILIGIILFYLNDLLFSHLAYG